MKPRSSSARRSIRRVTLAVLILVVAAFITYSLWRPGRDVVDGGNDRGRNGIWLAHGWLGGDEWFVRNGKTAEVSRFRDPGRIRELADRLRRDHITDVFPHLCPAEPGGKLPPVDPVQVERFLDGLAGFRVLPWI